MPTRDQLRRELQRHQDKVDRIEAALDALAGLPEQDPYEDGQVLRLTWHCGDGTDLTYVLLRVKGLWWSSGKMVGRVVNHHQSWSSICEWLVEGRVTAIEEMKCARVRPVPGGESVPPDRSEVSRGWSIERKHCGSWVSHRGHWNSNMQSYCPGGHWEEDRPSRDSSLEPPNA